MEGRAQPSRADVIGHPRLQVIDDALTRIILGGVRDGRTDTQQFATLTGHLATRLLWQACADLPLRSTSVPGFSGDPITVDEADARIAGVVILRAGLLFAPAFRALFPTAPLRQIGLRRDEELLITSCCWNRCWPPVARQRPQSACCASTTTAASPCCR
jgi:uracil phosphoribosyltransferase